MRGYYRDDGLEFEAERATATMSRLLSEPLWGRVYLIEDGGRVASATSRFASVSASSSAVTMHTSMSCFVRLRASWSRACAARVGVRDEVRVVVGLCCLALRGRPRECCGSTAVCSARLRQARSLLPHDSIRRDAYMKHLLGLLMGGWLAMYCWSTPRTSRAGRSRPTISCNAWKSRTPTSWFWMCGRPRNSWRRHSRRDQYPPRSIAESARRDCGREKQGYRRVLPQRSAQRNRAGSARCGRIHECSPLGRRHAEVAGREAAARAIKALLVVSEQARKRGIFRSISASRPSAR